MLEIDPSNLELSKARIELEKLRLEKRKSTVVALTSIIPIVAIISTIFYGIHQQHQQEKTQFQLKAAEIMFNATDPYDGKVKGLMFQKLFPEKLPQDIAAIVTLDSLSAFEFYEIAAKKELLRMAAAKAGSVNEIIQLWKKAFPLDTWPDSLITQN